MAPSGDVAQALVLVDLQRDFFVDDELERCREDLTAYANGLMSAARTAGAPVVVVRTVHAADRSTWTLSMLEDDQGMALEGSEGAELIEGLQVEDAVHVVKTRDSAFHATDLERILRRLGATTFAVAGVSTESCIQATATDAFARDLRAILVDRATASIEIELHRRVLDLLQDQYRQPVLQPDQVVFGRPAGPA